MLTTIFNTLNNPIVNSILLFLTISALLYAFKPKFMFEEDGKMKPFGYGDGKTCFTFPVVVFGSTLIGYMIFKIMNSDSRVSLEKQDGGYSHHYQRIHPRHSGGYMPRYHFGSESPPYFEY